MNKVFSFFRATATARFLIPAGIMMTIFGCILFSFSMESKDWKKTEAIVTKTELAQAEHDENGEHQDETYNTYIKYDVENETYEVLLGELSGYHEGDTIQVIYNPSNPETVSQPVGTLMPFAFVGAGILAIIGGIVSLVFAYKKNEALKEQEKEWNHEQ